MPGLNGASVNQIFTNGPAALATGRAAQLTETAS
jgi:hypothetical protein